MPALQPPARILVTGATGFAAVWIVQTLLQAGFAVRGTARAQSKADFLHKKFAREAQEGRFETVIVKDIQSPDAFDEAVKGVDAIAHTASPFHLNADDPDEIIKPAVEGTVGLLESARRYGTNVKRIIVLSSIVAVIQPEAGPFQNESNWNEGSIQAVKQMGRNAPSFYKYCASKTLAEKAAWEFYGKYKDTLAWDMTTLTPPYIYGPTIHEVSSSSSLNQSSADLFNLLCTPNAGGKTDENLAADGSLYIDVRDVAKAHLKAFQADKVGGERIIINGGNFTWQGFLDVAHKVYPKASDRIYVGRPGAGKDAKHLIFDGTKAKELLGMEYLPLEDTIRDALTDFEERGWFKLA